MTKYGVKEFLKEYKEALEMKPETNQGKPNLLQLMKAKKEQQTQRPRNAEG